MSDTGTSFSFYSAHEHHAENGTMLGFWLYLMSDCLIFALNTSLLLVSSITYGFAMLSMNRNALRTTLFWLAITGLLGAGFITLELREFAHLIEEGAGPQRSAFLSSFFTLVGTHGLHVAFGIVWLLTLMVQIGRYKLIPSNRRRLMCLSMFWHFLDVVWIGVFTVVYLMGVLP
jgi:cytochrome o ubiquinol oxidase subunit 3